MDMSGMIFVALAVVWAVYLIPRAVNRSEDELALMPAGWGEAPEDGQSAERDASGDREGGASKAGGRGALRGSQARTSGTTGGYASR